jgi:hypothetical protein
MAWTTRLRRPGQALVAALSLMLLAACSGKDKEEDSSPSGPGTVTVTVQVNYTRIPLVSNAEGIPTGLESDPAKFKKLPARGVQVRLWQGKDETRPDGTKVKVWSLANSSAADSAGSVKFSGVSKDEDTFIEVTSFLLVPGIGPIRIVADPAGIGSSLPIAERQVYGLRKAVDGSAPAGNPVPGVKPTADTTVTFDVGLGDRWWLTIPSATQLPEAVLEADGTGSRVLAILDTAYTYQSSGFGNAIAGSVLDLHYRPGVSHSRGSFIEYDSSRYPLSFGSDIQGFHTFGSIEGGASNDDAFDEGVLLPLFARNSLWSSRIVADRPLGRPLADVLPDVALLEALPYAIAAGLQKSPYLADTRPASVVNLDVRAAGSFASGPHSAPALMALAWDVILKANSLPKPGGATDWAKIDPKAAQRLFGLLAPPTDLSDRPNVFLQLGRLKEARTTGEPVDLAAIFTDAVLTELAAPYGIPWPRPASGPYSPYVLNWGADPNSLLTPLAPTLLSMVKAEAVDGQYPNTSAGEAAYSRFTLSKDTAYNLRVTTVPAVLPAGAQVEVRFTNIAQSFLFDGTDSSPRRVTLRGLKDTPTTYLVKVSVVSPLALVPDITATVALDVAD